MRTRAPARLMSIAGSLLASIIIAGCEGSTDPESSLRFEALTSTSLTGSVGQVVEPAPAVRVIDNSGQPASGVEVFFVPRNGSSVSIDQVTTGSDGVAAVEKWRLGNTAKEYRLRVEARGLADFEFAAIAAAGPPTAMVAQRGDRQTANTGSPLAQPLGVEVTDRYGNRVPNVPVTFTVLSGGGAISQGSAQTGASGVATSGVWTLGATPGEQRARAEAGGLQTNFFAAGCDETCQSFQLVFVRDGQIYRTSPGAGATRISSGFNDHSPAVSPDGRRIAFVRSSDDFTDVYLMDINGSNVKRRLENADAPAWSPDGRRLAVIGSICLCDLYVLGADDSTQSIGIATRAAQPAWSPDGQKIAFTSPAGDDGNNTLQVVNVDGTGLSTIGPRDGLLSHPSWSPDGTRIAFDRCIGNACDVHVMLADGSSIKQLTSTGNTSDPSWSPDGALIVLMQYEHGFSSVAYVDAANGGDPVQVQSSGGNAVWIPSSASMLRRP